jgi:hypothetical protein
MTATVPSKVALAELARVRTYAARQVAMGADKALAQSHVAKWCALAAWFGAVLPDDLAMFDPIAGPPRGKPLWTDYAPPGTSVADWRYTIALELRTYTQRAAAKAEAESPSPSGEGLGEGPVATPSKSLTRARNLLTLDRQLSLAANLPAMGAEQRKAA